MQKNLIAISTVMLAFSSLIYELSFSNLFSLLFGNTVEIYSFVIGLYMFSLGLGSFIIYLVNKKMKLNNLKILFIVELTIILLILLGSYFLFFFPLNLIYIFGFILIFLIGVLSGMELPLLMKLSKESFIEILSFDYIGSLIAGVSFPLFLYPKFGIIGSLFFALLLNSLILFWIAWIKKNKLFSFIFLFFVFLNLIFLIFLKPIQYNLMSYLIKDLIKDDNDFEILKKIDKNVSISIKRLEFSKYQVIYTYEFRLLKYNSYCLGLNGVTQVCNNSYLAHHLSYLIPFFLFNFNKTSFDILILGGGDGILANELVKIAKKLNLSFNITLIELDKKVIDFSRNDEIIKNLNNNIFNHINVVIGDAFIELRKLDKKFDFIFDDITTYNWENKIKFNSIEYFKLIKSKLKKRGVYITTNIRLKTNYPLDKKTLLFFELFNKSFKYLFYYSVKNKKFLDRTKNKENLIIENYENAVLLTDYFYNIVNLSHTIKYNGSLFYLDYVDNSLTNIEEVLNFYRNLYKEERLNSIIWPNYLILN